MPHVSPVSVTLGDVGELTSRLLRYTPYPVTATLSDAGDHATVTEVSFATISWSPVGVEGGAVSPHDAVARDADVFADRFPAASAASTETW